MTISQELMQIFLCGLLHDVRTHSKIQTVQEKNRLFYFFYGLKGMSPLKLHFLYVCRDETLTQNYHQYFGQKFYAAVQYDLHRISQAYIKTGCILCECFTFDVCYSAYQCSSEISLSLFIYNIPQRQTRYFLFLNSSSVGQK